MTQDIILILALVTIMTTSVHMLTLAPTTWLLNFIAWLIFIFTKEAQNDS